MSVYSSSREELLRELETDGSAGLGSEEAGKRLSRYGENRLKET